MSQGKETNYARKRKLGLVPYHYSAEYYSWCEAIKVNDPNRIANAVYDHRQMIRRRFGD